MTVTDQLKIIDNKIKANPAQYVLERLAAKISALSSGELRKYEYLTGEDFWILAECDWTKEIWVFSVRKSFN